MTSAGWREVYGKDAIYDDSTQEGAAGLKREDNSQAKTSAHLV